MHDVKSLSWYTLMRCIGNIQDESRQQGILTPSIDTWSYRWYIQGSMLAFNVVFLVCVLRLITVTHLHLFSFFLMHTKYLMLDISLNTFSVQNVIYECGTIWLSFLYVHWVREENRDVSHKMNHALDDLHVDMGKVSILAVSQWSDSSVSRASSWLEIQGSGIKSQSDPYQYSPFL
jgi:hypothetical protein